MDCLTILKLPNTSMPNNGKVLHTYREINEYTLNEFQIKLSHEAWGNIFSYSETDTNIIYNNFLDTFIKTFNASFPVKRNTIKTR